MLGYVDTNILYEYTTVQEREVDNDYQDSIVAVTDASVIEHKGTWAAILTDPEGRELGQAQGFISRKNLHSFRTELEECK